MDDACGHVSDRDKRVCYISPCYPADGNAIAGAVDIPYETFRKRFQQHIGVAPARYRAIRRIDAACAMLQQPGPTTRTIAASLGFSDEFHFSRRFKQITGMSPREFRRLLPHAAESPE